MSTTGRGGRWALLLVLVLGLATGVAAGERPLTATCDAAELEPVARPDPAVIPVMVTYMIYNRQASEDLDIFSTKLGKERLRKGFAPDGEFNRIWGPKGIRFTLTGFRTCRYSLSKEIDASDPTNPIAPSFTGIPNPDATATDLQRPLHRHAQAAQHQDDSSRRSETRRSGAWTSISGSRCRVIPGLVLGRDSVWRTRKAKGRTSRGRGGQGPSGWAHRARRRAGRTPAPVTSHTRPDISSGYATAVRGPPTA